MSIENPFEEQPEEKSTNNTAEQTAETTKTQENVSLENDDMITRAREITKKKSGKTSLKLEDLKSVLEEAKDENKTQESNNSVRQEEERPATKFYEDTSTPDALKDETEEIKESRDRKQKSVKMVFDNTSTPEGIKESEEDREKQKIENAVNKAMEVLSQTETGRIKKFKRKKTSVIIPEDAGMHTQPIKKEEATEVSFMDTIKGSEELLDETEEREQKKSWSGLKTAEQKVEEIKKEEEHNKAREKNSKVGALEEEVATLEAISVMKRTPEENEQLRRTKEKLEEELKVEVGETTAEEEKKTIASFEKLFGIKEGELDSIKEYRMLSSGQRRLVLKNMESMALTHIGVEATKKYKEDTARASFFPKIGRSILKNFYVAKAEKEISGATKTEEKGANIELLKDLTRMTKESGIDAHFESSENKKQESMLVIDYAGRMNGLTGDEKNAVSHFNDVARRLTEGNTRKAGKGLKLDITNNLLEEEYRAARADLMKIKKKEITAEKKDATQEELDQRLLAETMEIDKRVRMNQFFNENQDVEKELDQITSKPFWTKAFRNTALERGGYSAFGYGGRAVLTGALGMFTAPLIAAGTGGWMARKRAIKGITEEFEAAKLGEKSALMEKMSDATEKQRKQAAERIKRGKYSGETILAGKAFVEANTLSEKITKTLERINATADENEKARLRNVLDERLYYTRYVLDNRLVGFSGANEQLSEQYELLSKLAEGEVAVQIGDKDVNEEMKKRLESVLQKKAGHADTARTNYVWGQTLKGAALGAGFAYLGGELYHWWHGGGVETAQPVPHAKGNALGIENTQSHVATPYAHIESNAPDTNTNTPYSQFHATRDSAGTETIGIHTTPKELIPTPAKGGGTSAEIIPHAASKAPTNFETAIGKDGNIWDTAEKLAKTHGLSREEFAKAWGDSHSVFKTPDGHTVPLSKMGFVVEGDKVTYIPGAGGKGGHFELIDASHEAKSDAAFYDMILKRKGNPPTWLKAEVLHNSNPGTPSDKMLDNVEIKGFELQPLHETLPPTLHTPYFEGVTPRGPDLIPQGDGGSNHVLHALQENSSNAPSASHHDIAKTIAETQPGGGGMKGGEYLSKDFESKLVTYANAHGKKLELLRGNAIMEEKELTHNIDIYKKMRTNPFETKQADGLLHRIQMQLKVIKQNYGDIIDTSRVPKEVETGSIPDVLHSHTGSLPHETISAVASSHGSEQAIPLGNNRGVVTFEYDTKGDPIGMSGHYITSGSHGDEYLVHNYRNEILDFAREKHGDLQALVDRAQMDVQHLYGNTKLYEQLNRNPAYQKEATFILQSMKKSLEIITKSYGKDIINPEQLPDYLKK